MREYELLYMIQPDLEEEKATQLQERVAEIITQQGGQIQEVKEWGKRRLAYEIDDHREAFYIEVHFQGTPEVVEELERVIKITSGYMRSIVTRIED